MGRTMGDHGVTPYIATGHMILPSLTVSATVPSELRLAYQGAAESESPTSGGTSDGLPKKWSGVGRCLP